MKFHNRPAVETFFLISTIFGLFSCCVGTLPFKVQPDEVAIVFGKVFTYKLPAEMTTHPGYTFKFHAPDSKKLPSWLEFDATRNLLLGVPSHHDKGSHTIQLDIINDGTNKTADTFNFLTIEVVQYEEDLNHFKILRTNTLAQHGKNMSLLDCPSRASVIVATLVFDLNSRKLSGAMRVELLHSVAEWLDIDVDQLRWMPGKGEKTAFDLKDVVVLTAGPGWVENDPERVQERGVSVSWKIGCGNSVTESERSYASVSHLKSASQNGAFKNELRSPVVAWHVTHGRVQHRQVVRVRRQAVAQTPVPTSSFVPPSTAIVTRVIGTPTITRSPSVFVVTPTSTRVIPSPTRTTSPSSIPVTPGVLITTIPPENTPPEIINTIDPLIAEVDQPFSFPIPPDTFHDKEQGSTPNLDLDMHDINGNPVANDLWLKLDPNSQILRGVPKEPSKTEISLIVSDNEGEKSSLLIVTIIVVPFNNPPKLYNHIDVIKLYFGQPLVFEVPYDTFHDKEDGATRNLTLSMKTIDHKVLDAFLWVAFDAESQTIYALPCNNTGLIGRHEFLMYATDSGGKFAIDAFEIHVNQLPLVHMNHYFGLELEADYEKFHQNVIMRVKLCLQIGKYFGQNFNTSYKDMRVNEYRKGSFIMQWRFWNIINNIIAVKNYKEKYIAEGTTDAPAVKFKEELNCPISSACEAKRAYVMTTEIASTTLNPNVIGRADDDDDGTWWEYTIIPAFAIAALIFIIGLIIIICIRCRRKSKLEKNENIVFVQRKKPAVFREEYPSREAYGNQPLITPNEKSPLPPPAYPRSSTPTEDPSERLLSDSSPSYQPPFDSGHEPAGNSRPPVASYRLPPPYVAP